MNADHVRHNGAVGCWAKFDLTLAFTFHPELIAYYLLN